MVYLILFNLLQKREVFNSVNFFIFVTLEFRNFMTDYEIFILSKRAPNPKITVIVLWLIVSCVIIRNYFLLFSAFCFFLDFAVKQM
jgi:hypothetical protein